MVWLARNPKLEMTEYSRQIYAPRAFSYLGDDDGSGGGGDSETTPNYQPRKRCFQ